MSDLASASGGKAAATANICNTRGLHARASAKFVKLASSFDAEVHVTREGAFRRERAIKKWRRAWKLELIERANPGWRDLFADLF